jgi:hypothetical protein
MTIFLACFPTNKKKEVMKSSSFCGCLAQLQGNGRAAVCILSVECRQLVFLRTFIVILKWFKAKVLPVETITVCEMQQF